MNAYIANDNYAMANRLLKVSGKQSNLCQGDSGGPTFIGTDTTTVIAITSGTTSARTRPSRSPTVTAITT